MVITWKLITITRISHFFSREISGTAAILALIILVIAMCDVVLNLRKFGGKNSG